MAADPLAGDPGAITKLSSALADHQDDIRTGAHQVVSAQHDSDGWEGASKDRFTTTVGTIAPAAQRIISRLDAAIDVLDAYARVQPWHTALTVGEPRLGVDVPHQGLARSELRPLLPLFVLLVHQLASYLAVPRQ